MRRGVILDSNPEHRQLLFYALQTLGYEVQIAENVKDLTQLVENNIFDLVMLDIELPNLDGMFLAERVRQLLPDALLMVLSVYDKDNRIEYARYLGANAYVIKPFNLREVLKYIRENEGQMYCNAVEMSVL
jgi:DNA-binding response OmpR family regulator